MIEKQVAPPYYKRAITPRKYIANLWQTGTNAPTATEFRNELGVRFTFSRDIAGLYYMIADSDVFQDEIGIQISQTTNTAIAYAIKSANNEISIITRDVATMAATDNFLNSTTIEVTVY